MYDKQGETRRSEDVQFETDLGLAPNTYPEVLLPLMLGWPAPQRTRAFYSWINDRMVSRVYVETKGETRVVRLNGQLSLPLRRHREESRGLSRRWKDPQLERDSIPVEKRLVIAMTADLS